MRFLHGAYKLAAVRSSIACSSRLCSWGNC